MKLLLRFVYVLIVASGITLLAPVLLMSTVYADGGAPQLAYVAGGAQGVSVIDIAQRRATSTLTLAGQPHMLLLSPDGSALYVTQPGLEHVTVIAAKTGRTICAANVPGQPSLLALSIDATVLYVAGQGTTQVRALNPNTCALERTFETHAPVYGLAVAASTAANATPTTPNQVWIAGNSGLTVFDASGRLLGTTPVAAGPQFLSIPSGGFTAYVTTRQGSVLAVDLSTRRVIRTLISGGTYGPMDYDATTGEVYVPDRQHDLLDVLTPITANTALVPHEPTRQWSLNSSPQSIAITSDGQLGFVALADGQVLMLDIPGRNIIASIAAGGTPRFIITGLYPPASSIPAEPPPSASSAGIIPVLLIAGTLLCLVLLGSGWLIWRKTRPA